MQHYRPRGGNPFQERDSGRRFTSQSRRGRQDDGYYDDNRDYNRRYPDENDYHDDYRYGRDDYRNENEDYRRNNYQDDNYGGSYRESYGDRRDYDEGNYGNESLYSNERGGWQDDRTGYERGGYGRNRNYRNGEDGYRNDGWDRSMPRSEVRRIASMGGRASHNGRSRPRVSNRRRPRSSR
jgi:23S rRNA pseudouridine2605 synthase